MAMEEKPKNGDGLKAGRVVVNLTREELEFIDNIGRDALFSTGKRLTNNKIISAFIRVMKELGVKGDGLYSTEELKNRILVALRVRKQRRMCPRFKKEVSLSFHKASSNEKFRESSTLEIGEGGFRIELEEISKAKVGDDLEFLINDPYEPYNPITVFGRVSWIEKRDEDSAIEAGIKIIHLPEQERPRFSRLLYRDFYPDFYTTKMQVTPKNKSNHK